VSDAANTPPPEEPKMDIRKPKPIHSWRELLTEIGVIVIGVCIALAGEQTVEWLHWRTQVAEAREIIAAELAHSVEGAITRLRAEPCMERRFDELAQILDAAGKSGSLPPVGDIGLPPRNLWLSGSWESVVASQTATHFPRQQLADLSHAYKIIEKIDQFNAGETNDWRDLYALVGPGRRLDPASENELRKALSHARASSRYMTNLSELIIGDVKSLNLSFSAGDLSEIANVTHIPLTGSKQNVNARNSTSAICGPIGAVPANYGQAQDNYLPSLIGSMVKTIPDFSQPAP
jgi:hypothetical protein